MSSLSSRSNAVSAYAYGGDCWAASNLADLGAGVLTDLLEKGDYSGYASRQHLVSEALSLRASSGWLASQADGETQDEQALARVVNKVAPYAKHTTEIVLIRDVLPSRGLALKDPHPWFVILGNSGNEATDLFAPPPKATYEPLHTVADKVTECAKAIILDCLNMQDVAKDVERCGRILDDANRHLTNLGQLAHATTRAQEVQQLHPVTGNLAEILESIRRMQAGLEHICSKLRPLASA